VYTVLDAWCRISRKYSFFSLFICCGILKHVRTTHFTYRHIQTSTYVFTLCHHRNQVSDGQFSRIHLTNRDVFVLCFHSLQVSILYLFLLVKSLFNQDFAEFPKTYFNVTICIPKETGTHLGTEPERSWLRTQKERKIKEMIKGLCTEGR
jgi:hypothetical protein